MAEANNDSAIAFELMAEKGAAEVDRLCAENARLLGNCEVLEDRNRELEKRHLIDIRERDAALASEAALRTAADKIQHWHDDHDGGMVVSAKSVQGLWVALATPPSAALERLKADAGRERAIAELTRLSWEEHEGIAQPVAWIPADLILRRADEIAKEGK